MAMFAAASLMHANVATATVGYEGEYVFRGQKVADNVANASVSLTLPSQTNLGVTSYWNTTNRTARVGDETDISLSQAFAIDSATNLLLGGTAYTYPKASALRGQTDYTLEAFTGLQYKAFLTPTVVAGYNFNLKEVFAEGSLSQKIPVPFVKNVNLVPSVAVGYVAGADLLPNKKGVAVKDAYYYGSGKLDLVYSVKHVDVGVGAHANYLANSATSKNAWFGAFASVKF